MIRGEEEEEMVAKEEEESEPEVDQEKEPEVNQEKDPEVDQEKEPEADQEKEVDRQNEEFGKEEEKATIPKDDKEEKLDNVMEMHLTQQQTQDDAELDESKQPEIPDMSEEEQQQHETKGEVNSNNLAHNREKDDDFDDFDDDFEAGEKGNTEEPSLDDADFEDDL